MKKLSLWFISIVMILVLSSCEELIKGTILGKINQEKLTEKEREVQSTLFDEDILVKVKLIDGRTISAVIEVEDYNERLNSEEWDCIVVIDGKEKGFFFVK